MKNNSELEDSYYFEKTYKQKKAESIKEFFNLFNRINWIFCPIFYWNGDKITANIKSKLPIVPLNLLINKRLQNLEKGLYTIHFDEIKKEKNFILNPEIKGIEKIDLQKLSKTLSSLIAINKYPKLSRKYIEDFERWKNEAEEKLKIIFKIHDLISKKDFQKIEYLLIERICFWIGDEKKRPSNLIESKELINYLKYSKGIDRHLEEIIYFVLGKRNINPCDFKIKNKWFEYGNIFSSIHPEILFYLNDSQCNLGELKEYFKKYLILNDDMINYFLFELLILNFEKKNIIEVLPHLINYLDTLERLDREAYRRFLFVYKNLKKITENTLCNKIEIFDVLFIYIILKKLRENIKGFFDYTKDEKRVEVIFKPENENYLDRVFNNYDLFFGDIYKSYALNFPKKVKEEKNKDELNYFNDIYLDDTSPTYFKYSFLGLAVRILLFCEDNKILKSLSMWIDICRNFCPLGKNQLEHMKIPLLTVIMFLTKTNLSKKEIEKLFKMLEDFGEIIFLFISKDLDFFEFHSQSIINCFKQNLCIFEKIKSLNVENSKYIFENNLILFLPEKDFSDKKFHKFIRLYSKYKELFSDLKNVEDSKIIKIIISNLELMEFLLHFYEKYQEKYCLSSEILYHLINIWLDDLDLDKFSKEIIDYLLFLTIEEIKGALNKENTGQEIHSINFKFKLLLDFSYYWHLENSEKKEFIQHFYNFIFKDKLFDDKYGNISSLSEKAKKALCEMAGQDIKRFFRIIKFVENKDLEYIKFSWNFISPFKELKDFLISLLDQPEFLGDIFNFLEKINYILRHRLEEQAINELKFFLDIEKNEKNEKDFPSLIEKIKLFYSISGEKEIPKELEKALKIREALIREKNYLLSLKEKGEISEEKNIRLAKLEKILSSKEETEKIFEKNEKKLLRKYLILAKMKALNGIIDKIRKNYYKKLGFNITGELKDDIDFCIALYSNVKHNKRILKKVIVKETKGEKGWIEKLTKNIEFLKKFEEKGGDAKNWLKKYELLVSFERDNWRIYTEEDPIKILKLGNYVHTCFSIDKENNFTAVSYAVEKNKKVIYIENKEGKILGRRLMCIDDKRNFFVFYPYTIFTSIFQENYEKLAQYLFDLIVLIIATESNLYIRKEPKVKFSSLNLFTKAYYDEDLNCFKNWVFKLFSEESEKNIENDEFWSEFFEDPISNFIFFTDIENKYKKFKEIKQKFTCKKYVFENLKISRIS